VLVGKKSTPFLSLYILCALVVFSGCGPSTETGLEAESVTVGESRKETPTAVAEPTTVQEPQESETQEMTEENSQEEQEEEYVVAFRFPNEWASADGLGEGILQPLGDAALPTGFVEDEYLVSGQAVSYVSEGPVTTDGFWTVTEDSTAAYRTRMIFRYPPAEQFSGVVIVEWFNVTAGVDNSIDWSYLSEEIGRSGHAYVGVSAQYVGVMGRDTGRIPQGLIDTRGLPVRDQARYGNLVHPGDAYSFDIFSQAAVASLTILASPEYGLPATSVVAAGQSQSAGFLTSYLNAVHPLVDIFDGFLIHGRGDGAPNPSVESSLENVLIRTDVNVPVLIYETETDLTVLEYANARQEDADNIRTWEVAGAAHADTYSITYPRGFPRQASIGAALGCDGLINDGPQHETLQAALHHFITWVREGVVPPVAPRIEVSMEGGLEIIRDEMGIAIGGVRTPPVEAPLRILIGDPGSSEGFCFLFGQTFDIDLETLQGMYPSLGSYVEALEAAADESVTNGWLLQADAEIMIEEETERAISFGLLE